MTDISGRKLAPLVVCHTADLHLGAAKEALICFETTLELIGRAKCDALLIAGDLFDANAVASVLIESTFSRLNMLGVPVIVLPGNHDFLHSEAIYSKFPIEHYWPNISIINDTDGQLKVLPEFQLRIWGKPIVTHSPDFRPLEGLPSPDDGYWNIIMAHGLVTDGDDLRSSPIMTQELAGIRWDYLALGHVHAFRRVTEGNMEAFYCGSPSGPLLNGHGGSLIILRMSSEGLDIKRHEVGLRLKTS